LTFLLLNDEGPAFKKVTSTYYPTVGLHSNGEIVRANFGQNPFKFNIEEMIIVSTSTFYCLFVSLGFFSSFKLNFLKWYCWWWRSYSILFFSEWKRKKEKWNSFDWGSNIFCPSTYSWFSTPFWIRGYIACIWESMWTQIWKCTISWNKFTSNTRSS
jgi:hypothetical protein